MARFRGPVAKRVPVSSAQGKGMRLERFTARSAVQIAAAVPAVTRFFDQQDNNGNPAAGAVFQLSKGSFNRGEVADFNFVNIQRISFRINFDATLIDRRDINLLGNMSFNLSRQSDVNFLEFAAHQAWAHMEEADIAAGAGAAINEIFPNGVGYDVTDGGRFAEDVKVNSPTIGNAIAQFNFPGIWLVPGPFNLSLLQTQAAAVLQAARVVEVDLKGYRLLTNIS